MLDLVKGLDRRGVFRRGHHHAAAGDLNDPYPPAPRLVVLPDLSDGLRDLGRGHVLKDLADLLDREGLVRDFADKVIFHGAVDNQQTLAFGSQQDVRNEVLDNMRIFQNARWICAPCHNIQPVSPTENIVAMYKTIWENGKL